MSRASFRRHFWRTTSRTLVVGALAVLVGLTVVAPGTGAAQATLRAPGSAAAPVTPTVFHAEEALVDTEPADDTDNGTEADADAIAGEGEASAPYTVLVSPQSPVVTSTDEEFTFTVSLTNHTEDSLPNSQVTLAVTTQPLTSPDELSQQPSVTALTVVASPETSSLAAGQSRDLTVSVPADQFALTELNPAGVYQVVAEVRMPTVDEPDTVVVTSPALPFTWQGLGEGQSSPVTFVVPLVLPAHITVMPTQAQLSEEAPRLLDALEAAESAQATLAVDPRVIAGIRAYGEAAPAAARNFLEALELTDLPVFLLQYSDADPTAQAALGATELLEPVGLSFVTRNGVFPEQTSPSPTDPFAEPAADPSADQSAASDEPEPQADQNNQNTEKLDEHTPPSLTELGALTQAYPAAWPAPGQIDQATLTLLREATLTSLVISSQNAPTATTPRITFNGFTALVSHEPLTTLSAQWINTQQRTEQARIAAALVAELTLNGLQQRPGVVIALDRATAAESTAIPDLIGTLLAQPGITAQSERDLPTQPGALQSAAPAEQRVEMLRSFTAASEQITALAPLLTTPAYLPEYQQLRLLNNFATRYAAPNIDLTALNNRITQRNTDLLNGVSAISTDTTHLVGASSKVPVTLHNSLPFEATVTLRAAPGSAAIEVPEPQSPIITVPARGNSVHRVTVDTRVSSGETTLLVEVLDRDRTQPYAQLNMQLTLRSSYEAVLLTLLGISAVTLLIAGIWRSLKQRRSPQPTAESEHEPHNSPTHSSRE